MTLPEQSVLVLVLHWNRPVECVRTVELLRDQHGVSRVVVIDNGSTPANLEILRERLPLEIRVLALTDNLGWGAAFNEAIQREQGAEEYYLISAHDAIPHANCVEMLLEGLSRSPKNGIACPQYSEFSVVSFSPLRGVKVRAVTPCPVGDLVQVVAPHGTLCLFRRDCFDAIGGFDSRYFAYGDEAEIGLRARRQQWEVIQVAGAVVENPGTWTESRLVSYLDARNSLILARSYGGVLHAVARALVIAASCLRVLSAERLSRGWSLIVPRLLGVTDYYLGRVGKPGRFV